MSWPWTGMRLSGGEASEGAAAMAEAAAGQMRPMTFGERAVGLDFNPSGDPAVAEIKQWFAQIIDELDGLKAEGEHERNRLLSIAITEAQGAQMWAVKALTWREGA